MRGDVSGFPMDAARVALIWDLHLAGVRVECGEELYAWCGGGEKVAAALPVVPVAVAAAPVVEAAVVPVVWSAGEAGGVVVVVKGERPLEGAALQLLGNILRSVGVEGALGWVGVSGGQDLKAKGVQDMLVAELGKMLPQKVLVLGQDVLGIMVGKNLGVEGWQAAPSVLPGCEGVCVGVTYPMELLLAQPLFKRLAWQNVCKWKEGF